MIHVIKSLMMEKLTDRDYSLAVERGDKFLVSYPKSGNTWVQWIIYFLFNDSDEPVTHPLGQFAPENPQMRIVESYYSTNSELRRIRTRHRDLVIKSHSVFMTKFSCTKVLYIVRDPRDVALSYFSYATKLLGRDMQFRDFLARYLGGTIEPRFGSWGEHVGSWLGAMNGESEHFLSVRYEDLIDTPLDTVRSICRFFSWNMTDETIARAITRADFSALREREIKSRSVDAGSAALFFRKGQKDQWRNELGADDRKLIEARFANQMRAVGYL